jgi:hypothetical protein
MLTEVVGTDQAVDELENMGFDEGLLAYIVQDGKVLVVNKQDRMVFDHYADYLYDLADANGGIASVSKYEGTIPSTGGIKANLKAEIAFESGKKLIIAQDTTSEAPEYDENGNLVGDAPGEDVMDVVTLEGKFFSLLNSYIGKHSIPVEKWLQSKNIPTQTAQKVKDSETFTEFEEVLGTDYPNIYTFETGDDYVESVYVYDLGDGNVAIVDDYTYGYQICPKTAFEKFKEAAKQAGGKSKV